MPGHLLDAPCGSVYPGRGQLTCAIAVGTRRTAQPWRRAVGGRAAASGTVRTPRLDAATRAAPPVPYSQPMKAWRPGLPRA